MKKPKILGENPRRVATLLLRCRCLGLYTFWIIAIFTTLWILLQAKLPARLKDLVFCVLWNYFLVFDQTLILYFGISCDRSTCPSVRAAILAAILGLLGNDH